MWTTQAKPRPNVRKVHPLDAYETELRGDVEAPKERPGMIYVYGIGAIIAYAIATFIVWADTWGAE